MVDGEVSELACRVIERARESGTTLGTAESCTGGLASAALTSVPGSSAVVLGGVTSYAASVKERVLGVPTEVIEAHGVVSEQVARAMAKGACHVLGCDVAVSTTGIAGPGGAEPGKPVGTVCLGVALGDGVALSRTIHANGGREQVRTQAVRCALEMVLEVLA